MARFIPRPTDWWGTTWKFLLFVAIVIIALTVVEPRRGPFWTVLFILGGLWMYIALNTATSGYKCGNCGRNFQLPTTVNFFTVSQMGKNEDGTYYSYKNLTCPHCHKRSKARLMKRAQQRGPGKLLK